MNLRGVWSSSMLGLVGCLAVGIGVSSGTQRGSAQPTEAPRPTASVAAAQPSRSVVRLVQAGEGPLEELRYGATVGAREAMLLTTSARTTLSVAGFGGRATVLPSTRVTVEVGPVGDAGAGRLMVPFRFTGVEVLPTPGVSEADAARTVGQLQTLVGLEGFQLIDRQGLGTGVDLVVPPGTPALLVEQITQLRRSLRDLFAPFPSEPVGLGAVWEVRSQVEANHVAVEQVTTYRLTARAGEEITLDVQLAQSAADAPLPDPQPGVSAHLDTLASTGSGTMELKLTHLIPSSHFRSRSDLVSTVSTAGMRQPMRATMELEVWFGLP